MLNLERLRWINKGEPLILIGLACECSPALGIAIWKFSQTSQFQILSLLVTCTSGQRFGNRLAVIDCWIICFYVQLRIWVLVVQYTQVVAVVLLIFSQVWGSFNRWLGLPHFFSLKLCSGSFRMVKYEHLCSGKLHN